MKSIREIKAAEAGRKQCALPACSTQLPSHPNPGKPRRFCSPRCRLRSIESNRPPRQRSFPHPCRLCGRALSGPSFYCDAECKRLGRLRRLLAARSLKLGRDEADLDLAIESRVGGPARLLEGSGVVEGKVRPKTGDQE